MQMTSKRLARHATTALIVGAIAGLTVAGTTTTKTVHGKARAADSESDALGKFELSVKERGDRVKEKLRFTAADLDAKKDDEGNRPTYDLVLITDGDELLAII